MQAGATIRAAVAADLPRMCALGEQIQERHAQAWPQLFAPVEANREEPFWRSWIERPDHAAFVAMRGETIIGMVTASVSTQAVSILRPIRVCFVSTVVVEATERQKGVGRALVGEIERWARDNGAADIRLNVYAFNAEATRLYENLGYAVRSHTMGKLT